MRKVVLAAMVLVTASCKTVKVYYDYDKQADFSNYTTYNYYPDMVTGLSQLDENRLFEAIDAELQIKGVRFSEDPDFYINIKARFFEPVRNSSVGLGVGGTGRNIGGGVSIGIPVGQASQHREIRFDFIDSKKDELFWKAVSESTFNGNMTPGKREARLREIVAKVLAKYPPK
ncbi:DUF4136 domain-containing protein [Pseudozobellia thermophila]|uniref:DUF4136 domain-containing protein n=1 Tax=Pseudozobellia thermophila TaxID=192903 RepID=A0A1M6LTY0_9FLAO|nr:DUF4136 domain-containing protein [Pseudozobellia thermophila]SHJ74562.1 protein of unknown function [Pseudozobellia thermophila]